MSYFDSFTSFHYEMHCQLTSVHVCILSWRHVPHQIAQPLSFSCAFIFVLLFWRTSNLWDTDYKLYQWINVFVLVFSRCKFFKNSNWSWSIESTCLRRNVISHLTYISNLTYFPVFIQFYSFEFECELLNVSIFRHLKVISDSIVLLH